MVVRRMRVKTETPCRSEAYLLDPKNSEGTEVHSIVALSFHLRDHAIVKVRTRKRGEATEGSEIRVVSRKNDDVRRCGSDRTPP